MTTKNKVLFNINANFPNKIKIIALHPKKQWVAIINSANTFSLWNYRQKILIKSFNCNTLDDSKNFQIKEIVFFDRYSLAYTAKSPMRTNIIFVSSSRLYLYDYLTDAIKQINQKQVQQKNIRKVCVYSQSKICVSLNDGSFKVMDTKDLYGKNTVTMKSIRGYHTKAITWLISYCQNINEMPRVITVSAQDGLMACWNVDTLVHSNQIPDPANPSFKFSRQGGKNSPQEIISLQYDNSTYRLVTLTDSHIAIWSTMTGIQLRRIKNNAYKEIVVCNHFSFGANCFLVHTGRPQLLLLRASGNDMQIENCVDIKNYVRQGDNNILLLKNLPENPSQVFICTQSNIFVMEINKFYRPSYGFHQAFVTKLTTVHSRQFVNKVQGSIKPGIKKSDVLKIPFEYDILFNSFFLSFDNGWILFNLIEIQFQNMLFQQRTYKKHKVSQDSLLSKSTNTQSLIQIRFDGKQFFVFNKDLSYYQIYAIQEQSQSNLLGMDESSETLQFYSKLIVVSRGYAKDIVWHQYRQEVCIIKGFDKNGSLVEYVTQKKGFFGKQKAPKLSAQVTIWRACIYQKSKKGTYNIVLQSQPIKSRLLRVYNFGFVFGYSNETNGTQVIVFINDEKLTNKEIQGVPIWPERVFVSYCQTYQIFVYDGYFVIYRRNQIGKLIYFRSVQETIFQGIFWEKFFFFATKNSLFFLQMLVEDIILIKIADSMILAQEQGFDLNSDDLQETQMKMPEGQIQFLSIVNLNLLMLNYSGQVILMDLKGFPYIQFCLHTVLGNQDKLVALYNSCNGNLKKSMRQTTKMKGISLLQID